ncbi:MAG: hypothetical protein LAO51_16265 [Acidobacteriia bacterium]|nr:hypothetical protein [Terriglobia bacterium]
MIALHVATPSAAAAERALGEFPAENLEVYLPSLRAMDPDMWGALVEVLTQLREGRTGR